MDRQKEILSVFTEDDQVLKKSEIIELGGIGYYHNTSKHVGDTLSRMVNNGLLIRVRRGHFKRGSLNPKYGNKITAPNKNQVKLF